MLENIPEIEKYCRVNWNNLNYTDGGKSEMVRGLNVDSTFFSMFYSEFIGGGYKHAPYDGTHLVLTERAAIKYMGKTDCMGELFPGGNKRIAGVIKNYPTNSEFRFEFLSLTPSSYNSMGRSIFYVQLNHHARVSEIRKKIENHQSVAQTRFQTGEEKNWSFNLRTLPEIHTKCNAQLKSRFRNIQLLAIAGLLGLISSLMNHLVLFIGQQLKRRRHNTTFRSMGASTSYLFLKSLVDLVIPFVIALVASVFLIKNLFPLYQSYTQLQGGGMNAGFISKPEFNAMLHTAGQWTGFVIVLFLSAGSLIIAGMLGKAGKQTPYLLRRGLIVSQVFIGSFFLFIALTLYKQFHFTQNIDKGIRVENITQVSMENSKFDYQLVKEELLRSPYIEDMTFTTMPVLTTEGESYIWLYTSIIANEERYSGVGTFMVEPNFLEFFGMKMKEGVWISGETDAVVNEKQTQAFGEKKLLGETIDVSLGEVKLSGIVHNYYYSTMQYPMVGLVYHVFTKEMFEPYRFIYIKTKPESHEQALEFTQKIIETHQVVNNSGGNRFLALTDLMKELIRPERTLSMIFGFLSLACILVVSFGIYSLISLTIEQRHKEIAIRKVNGAEFTDMLRLFFREYLILVLIGNAIALPLGYYLMQRWFETYAYHTALDWWLFVIAPVVTCVIVFLSVVSKISEAARIDPSEALKTE
jgi:hypothetical protein